MFTESAHPRPTNTRVQMLIGVFVAVVAGIASRWLLIDGTAFALAVIAACAIALILFAPRSPLLIIVACVIVSAIAAQLPGMTIENLTLGIVAGLLTSLCLAGPLAIGAMLRHRRAFQRRGWRLAAMEARTRTIDIEAALQQERVSLAAEMHDGLGHSLTLIAVRLGQLSLNPALPPAEHAAVVALRQASAEAAEELGIAVRLLRHSDAFAIAASPPSVTDAIENASSAGIRVRADVPARLDEALSAEAQTALSRLVQEALTNAAKHAAGEDVSVSVHLEGSTVVAQVSNAMPTRPTDDRPPSGGFGLVGLRHRAAVLGGSLEVHHSPNSFAVTLSLPTNARPSPSASTIDERQIAADESEAAEIQVKATRKAIVLPAAILGAVLLVTIGYLVATTTLSVISPHRFSEIEAGDSRSQVEASLPLFELLDAPRDQYQARGDEECRFYESAISFFDRRDVYVICFDDTVVTRTGVVPSP